MGGLASSPRRRGSSALSRVSPSIRQIEVAERTLGFTDRLVILVRAKGSQLATALDVLDDLAELRKARTSAEFIAMEPASEQADWVDDVVARMTPAGANAPAACVVDTGVDQGHALLEPSLDPADCHACDPRWTTDDHNGHGTEMAGLALFGDLGAVVGGTEPVHLRHRLESVKLLPPKGQNPPELWGAITATAASRVEIQAPQRRRVFSVSITSDGAQADGSRAINVGQPSSWSAAVDALAAGLTIETNNKGMVFLDPDKPAPARLFLISAGNVDDFQDAYLDRCDLEPVEDPAQSWNGLSVGAYTELTTLDPTEPGYDGYTPSHPMANCLRTAALRSPVARFWPVKPDVLMEGGNVARSPDGSAFDWPYAFQRLTTKRRYPDQRPLTVTRQTSAATAQAAHLAASIMADYPSIRPETVKALIVHSAEWTPAMRSTSRAHPSASPATHCGDATAWALPTSRARREAPLTRSPWLLKT